MSVGRESIDPAATESFGFDYSGDLAAGDTIASSTWSFEDAENNAVTGVVTEVSKTFTSTTTSIKLSVASGRPGWTGYLKNVAPTTLGETLVRRMLIDIERE